MLSLCKLSDPNLVTQYNIQAINDPTLCTIQARFEVHCIGNLSQIPKMYGLWAILQNAKKSQLPNDTKIGP